jgi:phasin family protein
MTKTAAEINAFTENSRKFAEPAQRFAAMSAQLTESFLRHSYEAAGDFLNLSIAALHSATQAKDVPELVSKQSELARACMEKQTERSKDLFKLASEGQAHVTEWFDQTTSDFNARAQTTKAA